MQTAGFKILKNYSPKAIENISKLLHSYKIWAIINLCIPEKSAVFSWNAIPLRSAANAAFGME